MKGWMIIQPFLLSLGYPNFCICLKSRNYIRANSLSLFRIMLHNHEVGGSIPPLAINK